MFLKNPKLLLKSNSFRLITWYTVFFVLSSLAINIYAYTVISSYIYEQSRSEVEEDILELKEIYEEEGTEALSVEVFEDANDPFFVRLVTSEGKSPILRIPEDWGDIGSEYVKQNILPAQDGWVDLENEMDGEKWEVRTFILAEGSALQMGQTMEEREELLGKIKRVYLFAIIPIVLLGYLGGLFIADRALNPIRQLINTLDSIVNNSKIDVRVPEQRADILHDELISLFNKMLDKIETLINGMRDVLDNVAHDLRTPMTRLRGTAEVALQSDSSENLRDALVDCVEESERIQVMLNTLMDVSEAETGAMKLNPEKINVAPMIDEVVDLYSYVAEEKEIAVETGFPEELYVTADSSRLRQVLANLLDNAIKYTPRGGKVDIEADQAANEVRITVKDTGVGISERELDNIWDRLYRGDKSRTERGLGLGLSLVKAIVGAHRGYVEVFSTPGTGSAFSVHLPA
ncbi:MAG: two-component sensor histidine kinase [Thermodesulfobacteriota bacterium]|nr:MAG: two-component sensor histidine kinase [Thermodesulfobacteriota bacterium]